MNQKENETFEFTNQTLEFCRHIAGSSKIAAIALVDNYSIKNPNEQSIHEIMLIIHNFQPRLMRYFKTINNKTIFVFAVDQWIFERDVDRGFLGEAIASKLIFPYSTIQGEGYLREKEVELKKRLIVELLENLVVNFPELVQSILIKPQYFMYEVFSNRTRVFPLIAYDLAKLTSCLLQDEEEALEGYNQALKQLEAEEKIATLNGYITISKKFIKQCQNPKIKIIYTLTKESKPVLGFERGRINKDLIKKYCPDYKKAEFYVVGSEAMEIGLLEMLKAMRIPKKNIFSENFPGY